MDRHGVLKVEAVFARNVGRSEVRIGEFTRELIPPQRDVDVRAGDVGPLPGAAVFESGAAQADGGVRRTELMGSRDPRASRQPRTGFFGSPERKLVLSGPVPCGIEAPSVPRRLVDQAEPRRVLGKDL